MGSQRAVLVIGERGCGKSTTMRLIQRELRNDGRLPIFIDFEHAPELQGTIKPEKMTEKLNSFVSTQIRNCLKGGPDHNAFKASLNRTVFSDVGALELEEFEESEEGKRVMGGKDETLLACKRARELSKKYAGTEFEQFLSLTAVQTIRPQSPPVLIFDNREGLTADARSILFAKLTGVLRSRTLLFIAIRTENQSETDPIEHARRIEPFQLEDVDQSLLEIARIRNKGAYAYVQANRGSLTPRQVESAAASQYESFKTALAHLTDDAFSYRMASHWLNSDVRHFLGLMAELSRHLPRGNDARETGAWLSTTLFRTRTHRSLLDIFNPAHCSSTMHVLPFFFLPLRILFYVKSKGCEVPISRLRDDFASHFGIGSADIIVALNSLSKKQAGCPTPLRMYVDDKGASHVLLLKCGEEFVENAVYRFDFLAHLFDKVESASRHREFSRLAKEPGMTNSRLKLLKGIFVIDNYVLPEFRREHPYMADPSYVLTDGERRRLRSFDELFSFGQGRWFIVGIRRSLETYASSRNLKADVASIVAKLQRYDNNLNNAAAQGNVGHE